MVEMPGIEPGSRTHFASLHTAIWSRDCRTCTALAWPRDSHPINIAQRSEESSRVYTPDSRLFIVGSDEVDRAPISVRGVAVATVVPPRQFRHRSVP